MAATKLFQPVMVGGAEYELVAASQTDQVLGGTGGKNDFIARVIINVSTTLAGPVQLQDGSDTAFDIAPTGTAVGVHVIELGIFSRSGAWSLTTPANCSAIAVGDFGL